MPRVVVIGAGVAGLSAALALGRAGHEVTLLERDDIGSAADAEEAFAARGRRGAPQTRHSHAFLARLRLTLKERAPDVLAALLAAGATELDFLAELPPGMQDFVPEPGDEDLMALACRRTTFEWVLRDQAMRVPGFHLVHGTAAGLVLAAGAPPRAVGVEMEDGSVIEAEVIVDAMGRRSPLTRWLTEAGGPELAVVSQDTGIVYSSRFYRLRDGAAVPAQEGPIGGDLGYMKYAIFPADNDTFSITFAVPANDPELRVLLHEGPFDRATEAMPATSAWVEAERSVAITDVEVMARMLNRKVDFMDADGPVVLGLHAVGDSHVCTNPLYGRGCSLALVHAFLLADVLAEHPADPGAAATAFEAVTATELLPWYEASVAQDAAVAEGSPAAGLLRDGLMPAARRDPRVLRALLRSFNLLSPPAATMSDPYVLGKVLEAYQERGSREPVILGPDRDGLLACIG